MIYFVIDNPQTSHLEMTFKKCDISTPTLSYTNDVKQFQKGLYSTAEELENMYERKLVKTKKSSKTIHVKVNAEETEGSLFTISVSPAEQEVPRPKVKAGNHG